MPYRIIKRDEQYWVYKLDADGKPTERKNKKGYSSRAEALPYLRALYAAERRATSETVHEQAYAPMDDHDDSDSDDSADLISQEAAGYVTVSPYDDLMPGAMHKHCGNCEHYLGHACEIVASEPFEIVPEGYSNYWSPQEYMDEDGRVEETTAPTDAQVATETAQTVGETATEIAEETPPLALTRETIREISAYTEFRGKPPHVPFAPGVDLDAIKAKDPNPNFVMLKVAQVGRISKNGVLYDEELVSEIERQIIAKRPGAIFGHIPKDQRDTAHPIPVALWVGATRVGDVLWGKAYIRDRAASEYVNDLRNVNSGLGTSIYGSSIPQVDATGVKRWKAFDLEQIDFASPDRASLDMGGEFFIVSETVTESEAVTEVTPITETEIKEGDIVDRQAVKAFISELSIEDFAELMGEDFVSRAAETYARKQKKKMVAAEMVDNSEAQITELTTQTSTQARELNTLRTRVAEYEQREFNEGVNGLIDAQFAGWKMPAADHPTYNRAVSSIASLKRNLRRDLDHELGGKQDLVLAKAKVAELFESDDFRPLVEMTRDSLSGGNLPTNGSGKPMNTNEAIAEASARMAQELMGGNKQ